MALPLRVANVGNAGSRGAAEEAAAAARSNQPITMLRGRTETSDLQGRPANPDKNVQTTKSRSIRTTTDGLDRALVMPWTRSQQGMPTSGAAAAPRAVENAVEHVEAVLVAAERRHQVNTVGEVARLAQQLAGQLDADLLALVARFVHAAPDGLGNLDARHLVVQELGVPERLERQDANEDRHLGHAAEPVEEALPALEFVHRLRHHVLPAGFDLLREAVELRREIVRFAKKLDAGVQY